MILDPAIRLVTQFANDRFQFLAEPKYDLLARNTLPMNGCLQCHKGVAK